MSTQPSSLSAFGALYRNPRVGDLIIRTADEVDFHIYKAIIAGSSTVFADMLAIAQPTPSVSNSRKPTVDVSESSAVWETLIMLCYAPRPPTPEDFDDLDAVRAVLDAGVKYQMDVAVECARLGLLLPKFVEKKPLAAYALGCAYKLPDVVRVAARCSLRFPIYFEYSQELDLLPLRAYHHLSEYRRKCGAMASTLVNTSPASPGQPSHYSYQPLPDKIFRTNCASCNIETSSELLGMPNRSRRSNRLTVMQYLRQLHKQMEFLPDANLALSQTLLQEIIDPALKCQKCVSIIHKQVAEFSVALYAALEDAISQVELMVDE